MSNTTNLTDRLETVIDDILQVARMTADDGTRDELCRVVGDLENIIDGIPENTDE